MAGSEDHLQRSISDLFSDDNRDDDMTDSHDIDGREGSWEDETESSAFTGKSCRFELCCQHNVANVLDW